MVISLLAGEFVVFIILIMYNIKYKIIFEKKHGNTKATDKFKLSFYDWNLKSGIGKIYFPLDLSYSINFVNIILF